MSDDVAFLSQLIRDSMELQAQEAAGHSEYHELDMMKPLQVVQNIGLSGLKAETRIYQQLIEYPICKREIPAFNIIISFLTRYWNIAIDYSAICL